MSKVHFSCDGKGRPLSVIVTAGAGQYPTLLSLQPALRYYQ
jgi:hypothetical protein